MSFNIIPELLAVEGAASPKFIDVPGTLLTEIAAEDWLHAHFGPNYASRRFERYLLTSFLAEFFIPPAVSLGIVSWGFSIPGEHVEGGQREFLDDIDNIRERAQWFDETCELDQCWYSMDLDYKLLARFIPLFQAPGGQPLFHAHHLDEVMRFIHRDVARGQLLLQPTGPFAHKL